MTNSDDLTLERRLWWLTAALLGFGMILHLGVQPFLLEEPRRILIALEMLENGNLWVPTEFGRFYYSKPPVYNWLLIASAWLGGGFSAFALRLPTVLSVAGLAYLCYWLGRRYVDERFGWLSALLFTTCGGILFYFSALAEIDLFYALVTLGSMVAFFHFYQLGRWWPMFLLTYMLALVGTLTKGPTSVLYLGFTVLGYLAWKRDWRALFSTAHIVSGLLYLALLGGYFWVYHQYNPILDLLEGLWGQSREMTVLEEPDPWRLARHIAIFPLDVWKDLLPGALLTVFALRRGVWAQVRGHELLWFAVLVFAVNIPVYWFSPGGRTRYIYMLYPFLCILLLWFYRMHGPVRDWRWWVFRLSAGVAIGAAAVGALAIHFVPDLDFLGGQRLWMSAGFFAAFVAVGVLYVRRPALTLTALLLATALARCLFSLTALPQRAQDSKGQRAQLMAQEMLDVAGEKPFHIFSDPYFPHDVALQVHYLRGHTLRSEDTLRAGVVYWANLEEMACTGLPFTMHRRYFHHEGFHGLVEIRE